MAKRKAPTDTQVELLPPDDAIAEHRRLVALIGTADEAYHGADAPVMSDAEYDGLKRAADALEERFPALKERGVAAKVGAKPSEKFAKVRHRAPMLSLANSFTAEDVAEFEGRIRSFLNLKPDEVVALTAEPKIDGLSLSLAL